MKFIKGQIPWNKGLKGAYSINAGENHPLYGKHHTADAIEKIRVASTARIISDETRKKMSLASLGKKKGKHRYPRSPEHCEKIRLMKLGKARPDMLADQNPLWKGDRVGYVALHTWVERQLGKPKMCANCGTINAKRFEWANLSGKYKRDITDWKRLCCKCHHKLDDIANRNWETRRRVATFA